MPIRLLNMTPIPGEFTFRFNRRFWPMGGFQAALGIATRVKAPTYVGLYDGTWAHPGGRLQTGQCSVTG